MSYHLPKSDDETMQPQSESQPENQLDLKNASGKEVVKYLKISEDVHQRVQLVLQYVTACNECLVAAKESGNPPQCSCFCKDCMKYNTVCSEHGNLYADWLCDTLFGSQSSLVYLIKPHAIRSMTGMCHLLCRTHSMIRGN